MLLTSYRENLPPNGNLSATAKDLALRPFQTDDEALNTLYRNHSSELLITILRVIPQHETAEDVLHDTFMKIKSCIHSYHAERSQLLTWSKAVARNMALDYLRLKSSRNNKLNQSIDYSQMELGVSHSACFNIDRIGLRQLLTVLSAEQIRILQLFYYEGYTHEEIAELMKIPLGTIKTRIRTAIIKLRKFFN